MPLLVAGHVRPRGRVQGVDEVGDGVDLLTAHEPGLGRGRGGVDLQRGVAVSEPGEGHRVLVAGHQQPLVGGVVHPHLVVQVGVGPHLLQLQLTGHPALVNPHQLLVQVVEARPGGPQPVLEDRHVAHPPVRPVEVVHGGHGQVRVHPVLGHAQGPRPRPARGVGGRVGEVPPGDDDVVPAREEGRQVGAARGVVHGLPAGRVLPAGAQLGAGDRRHVRRPGRVGQVGLHALAGGVGHLVAVVGVPVVEGEDLKEVGDAPELGHRVEQGRGGQGVNALKGGGGVTCGTTCAASCGATRGAAPGPQPGAAWSCAGRRAHNARLLRGRLQVACRAEGAGVAAVLGRNGADQRGGVGDGAVAAAGHGPHLRAGEGADLFDGAVGQSGQWLGGGGVGKEHDPIVPRPAPSGGPTSCPVGVRPGRPARPAPGDRLPGRCRGRTLVMGDVP